MMARCWEWCSVLAQVLLLSLCTAALAGDCPDWQQALDQHNAYRALHGVPPLTWSSSLHDAAQAWSEKLAAAGCQLTHSQSNGAYGENLYSYWGWRDVSCVAAVAAWYKEIRDPYPYNFTDTPVEDNKNSVVGHFTQMVWKSTTQVGCAAATGQNPTNGWSCWIITCRYTPPGNYWTNKYLSANVLPPLSPSSPSPSPVPSPQPSPEPSPEPSPSPKPAVKVPRTCRDWFHRCDRLGDYCAPNYYIDGPILRPVREVCGLTCQSCLEEGAPIVFLPIPTASPPPSPMPVPDPSPDPSPWLASNASSPSPPPEPSPEASPDLVESDPSVLLSVSAKRSPKPPSRSPSPEPTDDDAPDSSPSPSPEDSPNPVPWIPRPCRDWFRHCDGYEQYCAPNYYIDDPIWRPVREVCAITCKTCLEEAGPVVYLPVPTG